MKSKILVIGGTQFVGLHLVYRLVENGYDVTVLNRGITKAELPESVKRIYCDRHNYKQLKSELKDKKYNVIFDINCYKPKDVEIFIEIFKDKIEHYVFCSTGSVYEQTNVFPIKEDFKLTDTIYKGEWGSYGYDKVKCEDTLFKAYEDFGFPATTVRPSYIYGPHNQAYREAFFFDRIIKGRPIIIPGYGHTINQFGYIDDLAQAFISIIGNKKAIGNAYNISGTEFITLNGYVEIVEKVVRKISNCSPIKIISVIPELLPPKINIPFPYSWRDNFFMDISKAINELSWSPKFSLEDGLTFTYKWYIENCMERKDVDFSIENEIISNYS